jgi:large subunit ribosomal protein L15
LVKAGVLRRAKDGVRLLGSGEIKAKVAFSVWGASKSAMQAVEKAGGSVTLLAPKRPTGEQPA